MRITVRAFCKRLVRSKLLSVPQVRAIHSRWVREAGVRATDPRYFTRWLVRTRYLTSYQVKRVLHGHSNCLFLDQYKILRRIGEGALARIYLALQADGQAVALKVLPPSRASDPHLRASFEREARAAWRLKHPNVVRALNSGEVDGIRYLVLEYLDGETLADVLQRRGRLPPAEAVRLIYQALLGLEHLHQRGLVHGAIEPTNLMIVPRPAKDRPDTTRGATVKLLDSGVGAGFFAGLAQPALNALRCIGEAALPVIADDVAPEQASDPAHSDIRADIYGLGCILYHCLTGQTPFPAQSGFAQLLRHATEMPRPLRDIVPTLPEGLQEVIDRLLAKDPARRYRTPEIAARALRPYLSSV